MADKTIAMADDRTQRMDDKYLHRLVLTQTILETNKDKYEIDLDQRIGIGGESQVYLAKRVSDGEQVVIKIYDTYTDDPQSRLNRKAILEFLNNNSDYSKSHIMPLWDSGHIEMLDIESDDFFTRPLDVIPYCSDGELKHCDFKTLKEKVIPEVLIALNLLHSNNLVHRDIKPTNIYWYNGFVLLADFGITSRILTDIVVGTQTRRGTPGYTAPEMSEFYYVVATDYYSLGCTVATLYKGKHVYQNLIDTNDIIDINIAMRKYGLPLDCPEEEKSLQLLVNALIMRDENMRAGYDGVKLWLNDPNSFERKWRNTIVDGFESTSREFNFEGNKYKNRPQLTEAIQKNWTKGKQYLYSGTFKGFYDAEDPTLAIKAHDIVEDKVTALDQDLGLAMFLHFLNTTENPDCPIYWCGQSYDKLSDISTAISTEKADEAKIITMLKSKFLSWKFKNTKDALEETIKVLQEIEELTDKHSQLGYYFFMYSCATDKDKNKKTSDDVFKELTKDENKFYEKASQLLENDKIFAFLAYLGYKDTVVVLKDTIKGTFISNEGYSDLFRIYRLFESICKDKTSVREHFLKYGDQAYIYWLQQNLSLYKFNSTEAKKNETEIKSVRIGKELTIQENWNGLSTLKKHLKTFLSLLQNNYLLTHLGLSTSQDTNGITTNNTHGFFVGKFYSITVPVGFLKSIGM